jgi:hypothetical protein
LPKGLSNVFDRVRANVSRRSPSSLPPLRPPLLFSGAALCISMARPLSPENAVRFSAMEAAHDNVSKELGWLRDEACQARQDHHRTDRSRDGRRDAAPENCEIGLLSVVASDFTWNHPRHPRFPSKSWATSTSAPPDVAHGRGGAACGARVELYDDNLKSLVEEEKIHRELRPKLATPNAVLVDLRTEIFRDCSKMGA